VKIPSVQQIRDFIFNLPIIVTIIDWSKTHSFPGFFNVPIYDVTIFILNEIKRDTLVSRANSIAFSFFLSIFPGIIFIFTLIPYILPYFDFLIIPYIQEDLLVRNLITGEVDFNATIIQQIGYLLSEVKILPENARAEITEMITELATKTYGGRLYFVLLLTVFFSSNGMMTLFRGFEKSHSNTFKKRSLLKKRILAILLTLLLAFLVLVAVFLIVLGQTPLEAILSYFNANQFQTNLVQVLKWIIVIAFFYSGISVIYRYGAATFIKFKWFSPGATLASVLSIISSILFSLYVEDFGAYNDLYLSFGTIIVIMLWIQINAFILLVGFELNTSIAVNRDLKIAREELE
jgi:membrane protein